MTLEESLKRVVKTTKKLIDKRSKDPKYVGSKLHKTDFTRLRAFEKELERCKKVS